MCWYCQTSSLLYSTVPPSFKNQSKSEEKKLKRTVHTPHYTTPYRMLVLVDIMLFLSHTHTLQSTNYGIIQFRHNAYRIMMMMMMMMMMTAIKQNRYKSNNKIRMFKLKAKREHHDKYKRNNSNNNDNNNNHKFFIYSLPFISSRLETRTILQKFITVYYIQKILSPTLFHSI